MAWSTSTGGEWRPDVFEYLDYRAFLNDWRERARAEGKGAQFTYTRFAQMAGLDSRGHMHQIFRGSKKLAADRGRQLGRRLFRSAYTCATRREAAVRYLGLLCELEVLAGTARFEAMEAALALGRAHRGSLHQPQADLEALQYLGRWWILPLRQLARLPDFEPDPAWVRRRTWIPVAEEALARDLADAVARGDLVPGPDGRLVASSHRDITLGHDLAAAGFSREVRLAAGQLHRDALDVVKASIDGVPSEARHLELKFVAVPRRRLGELRRQLAALIDQFEHEHEDDADTVFQIHLSAVPLTRETS